MSFLSVSIIQPEYTFDFIAQLWKLRDDSTLLNKLRLWPYYYKDNTTIPNIGTTGLIKVYNRGVEKFLSYHNLTKAFTLAENISMLSVYQKWQWHVEPADDWGWSRITNADNGLYLTSKLSADRRSILTLEKEGMHNKYTGDQVIPYS